MPDKAPNVTVVVLGDIGRSPRMQYHALSLARRKYDVDLIGYAGSNPLPDIVSNERITITHLQPLQELNGPRMMQYVLKTFWQTISLLLILSVKRRSDFVLCQNPPAIPTLFVCWLYCLFTRAKFIIDWHNYAYSIMALSHGENHFVVKVARNFEFFFGRMAYANLCVTNAMKSDLGQRRISAKVLYDRPADIFHPISVEEKHNFLCKMSQQYSEFGATGKAQLNQTDPNDSRTILTECEGDQVKHRSPRPGVLFSSTSWTQDEDFSILLNALEDYDEESITNSALPKLICVITGKGPMKEYYMSAVRNMRNIQVVAPWLEAADYPTMVASADLGVCLHTSSSGLDLPMKVVDMFGSGLPVCAFQYECLNELVKHEENGYTFEKSKDLAKEIMLWFEGFPNNERQNGIAITFRENIKKFFSQSWDSNWDMRAKSLFT